MFVAVIAAAYVAIWFAMETTYRLWVGIPLNGGYVAGDQPLAGSDLWLQPVPTQMLHRFKKSTNPILKYEPNPGFQGSLYVINSHGFRDHEYALEKPADTFRIAVLGDSVIWGHGVPLDQTFAKQLQRRLNDAFDRNFQVMNFGVSGYNTRKEVEWYRVNASRFDPDLVIVGYYLNDMEDASAEADHFDRVFFGLLEKSYLFAHVRRAAEGLAYNKLGVAGDEPDRQAAVRKQFELLQSYCNGRRNVVLIFPVLDRFENYLFALEHRRVVSSLDGLNYEVLDLMERYRRHAPQTLRVEARDTTHPNALGHAIAADAAMKLLVDKQLIPVEPDD